MNKLPLKGALKDEQLEIIENSGLWIKDGVVKEVGDFEQLKNSLEDGVEIHRIEDESVCLPSYVDCHTHIAFAGNRANDFAMRNSGSSYLEIAKAGGGIWNSVTKTRNASLEELKNSTIERADILLRQGITTIEVKSGYGLSVEEELKMLRAIKLANATSKADLIPTCLAAHMKPRDYEGSNTAYLTSIQEKLFPILREENLTQRIDAFVEQTAFSADEITPYLTAASELGFDITIHADQFTTDGSKLAVELKAVSADHLEASGEKEIALLASSDVVAVALPSASLGIGCAFIPARKLLDAGASLAIATDWNPGSAPNGQLMVAATILGTMQKLSNAEVLAGITVRAANALRLEDRGVLEQGKRADFVIYKTNSYQNITYMQGTVLPESVWKDGEMVVQNNGGLNYVI